MRRVFIYSMTLTAIVAVPASVYLAVLAEPIVTVVFSRGAFDAHDARETARSLVWQAGGVWAVASVRNIVPMFHAWNDTRTPILCSAINVVVFGASSYLLMGPMQHAGIAAAISLAAFAQVGMLLFALRWKAGRLGLSHFASACGRVLLASMLSAALGWVVARLGEWERGGNDVRNIGVTALSLTVAGASYLFFAKVLRVSEVDAVLSRVRARFRKS